MAHVELLRNNERANEIRTAAKAFRVALDAFNSVTKAHVGIITQTLSGPSNTIDSFAGAVASYDIPGEDATAKTTSAKLLFDEMAAASADNATLAAKVQFCSIVG